MLNVFLELKLAFIVNATRQSRRCIQLELAQTRTGLQTKLEGATRLPVMPCLCYFHFQFEYKDLRFLSHSIVLQEPVSSTFLEALPYLHPLRTRKKDTESIAIQHR